MFKENGIITTKFAKKKEHIDIILNLVDENCSWNIGKEFKENKTVFSELLLFQNASNNEKKE